MFNQLDGVATGTAVAAHLAGISGGEGWVQFGELALAFLLSALIGLEREIRQKSAGLRTHTLVGIGAALIMLVSKYGFTDVLVPRLIVLDPSRVAAQIVSGIGFLGAGLIFVRRDAVRGLTTAAAIWVTAGIGMASGAGLPLLAIGVTGMYFIVVYGLTPLSRRLPPSGFATSELRVIYLNGRGVLRRVLEESTGMGFQVARMNTEGPGDEVPSGLSLSEPPEPVPGVSPATVSVLLAVQGRGSVADLAAQLEELDGVLGVRAVDVNAATE